MSGSRWSWLFAPLVAALCALAVVAAPATAQEEDEPPAGGEEAQAPAPAGDDTPAAAGDDTPGDGDQAARPDEAAKPDEAANPDDDAKPDEPAPSEPPAPAAGGDADGDGTPDAQDQDDDNDGVPDRAEAAADDGNDGMFGDDADVDGDGTPDEADNDDDNDGVPDAAEDDAQDVAPQQDEDGELYIEADADGDGQVSAEELAAEQAYDAEFADIPNEITDDALDQRPDGKELLPSISIEDFRKLVRLAKAKVLPRMEKKIAKKADQKMAKISWGIFFLSLAGFLLLFMPLALRKKYPGQGGSLFKYSALAALTFFVTVNLFGAIMVGMRTTQGALSSQTNPQLKIASGFFDALDHNAEDYIVMGKELFAPTLEQLNGKSDEQPAVLLIENGQKIVEQAKVFKTVAGMFKKINFVFGVLPIVLLGVTLLLFMLAIKPTLIEIIKLPATIASGQGGAGAGGQVVKKAMNRVKGELIATLCTLGVLTVLSVLSGFVLGKVVEPALDSIISYFSLGVTYLQFVKGASSGQVMLMLFSVILFLILELAVVIASMSFFLGKSQKIFQQRFNEGVPLSAHARWWKWAIPSVLLVQLVPWLYLQVAAIGVEKIEDKITAGATQAETINWTLLMLAGPLFLVIGFLVFFWATRGLKATLFMAKYKVKLPASTAGVPMTAGNPGTPAV